MRWLRNKFERLRTRKRSNQAWRQAIVKRPKFFAHWVWVNAVPLVR
jgi:hypothetical protein